MRRLFFAVFLVVACATVAAAGPAEEADSAYQRGDYALAAQLLRSRAEQGNAHAQYNLGLMYHDGQGIPQDYQMALKWYRKAAEQGDAWAQAALGGMYAQGKGVPQDYAEATKLYRKAAEHGNALAQNDLGVMYEYGFGVPQDFVRAYIWYNVAAAALSGDIRKKAMEHRASVASKMTAAQIEKAQEMARRCQQSKFKECD